MLIFYKDIYANYRIEEYQIKFFYVDACQKYSYKLKHRKISNLFFCVDVQIDKSYLRKIVNPRIYGFVFHVND